MVRHGQQLLRVLRTPWQRHAYDFVSRVQVLLAFQYLQKKHAAHRDVLSDNFNY